MPVPRQPLCFDVRGVVPLRLMLTLLVLIATCQGSARAERTESRDLPCGLVEKDNIHIDGLTSDWEGVAPVELLGVAQPGGDGVVAGGRPLRVRLRCNYDERAMYLLIDVEDDIIVRSRQAATGEDHVELAFPGGKGGVDRLLLWPGHYASKVPRSARWASGKPLRLIEGEGPAGRSKPLRGPPAFEVYDAAQQRGYAIEMRLPLKLLPGYKPGVPLAMGLRVVDVDSRARPVPVAIVESGALDRAEDLPRVLFEDAQSGMTALLESLSAGPGDIWWEQTGNLGTGPGRVVMIGRSLAVVSQQYGYQDVAAARGDIKEVQLVDIGEGQQAALIRTAETGNGGGREVARLWRVGSGGFKAIFAAEVRKQKGAEVLTVQLGFAKRGKAVDVVLSPRPAVGFTAATYQEAPAEDVQPILLPWKDQRARFTLKDGAYVRAE